MAEGEFLVCDHCGQFEDLNDSGRCPYCGDYAPHWAPRPKMDNFNCPFCKSGNMIIGMTRTNWSSIVEFNSTCDHCGCVVHGYKPEPKPEPKPPKKWYKFW